MKKGNEGIYFSQKRNLVIHYTSEGAQISKWDGQQLTKITICHGALKSVCFNNRSELFLGLNFGLKKWQNERNVKKEFVSLPNFKKRIYGVDFDENTNSLYVATANGLVRETKNGDASYLKYQGDVIYANTIKSVEGKIYVGSKKSGIIVYENDKLIDQVKSDQSILQIEVYKGKVFYLTSQGLSIAGLDSKTSFLLNNSTGLSCSNFSHFHINNNTLYVTDSKTLQYISIDKIFVQHEAKPLHFKHILINDKPNSSTYLNANERKLEFVYGVNTLRYRDNINYRYKLDGFDKNWIYADYSENAIKYNALPSGEYEVQSLNGDQLSAIAKYDFKIDSPFHQKWWFYLLIILCSVLILGIFFLQRLKKIRNKGKAKLQQQKNKTDMLESELRALRSQMNPHFIFNSLNSIQDLILKEDTDASYDYIVLFADLVRSTLNYSNKDFIPIDQEIEFLKVYLSLEKLRFKEDFEYEIIANIDNDIKVPSLLIQPFIENALLHGLIHKEGLKTLKITFELENENLICSILDNGVGRKKSKEIQNRQVAHESFALQAIEKRLKILNEQNDMESGFEIIDLYVNDIAAGTEVILNLPYRKLY